MEATWASLREEEREAGQEREPDEKLRVEGWGYYLEARDEAGDSDRDFLDY